MNLIQKCLNLISPLAISLLKIDKGLISLSNTAEAEGRVQGADETRQKHKEPEEVAEGEKKKKQCKRRGTTPSPPPMKDKYCTVRQTHGAGNQKHLCKSHNASQEG